MIEWDDDGDVCFVFQEDPECRSVSQLKDVRIGEAFIFNNQKFTKIRNEGWFLGVSNVKDDEGHVSHLHPTTRVSLLN